MVEHLDPVEHLLDRVASWLSLGLSEVMMYVLICFDFLSKDMMLNIFKALTLLFFIIQLSFTY